MFVKVLLKNLCKVLWIDGLLSKIEKFPSGTCFVRSETQKVPLGNLDLIVILLLEWIK